ncbi:MAG: DUF5103 domain-containing protein [Flavobacteriales bacterium]|jgi:hypothetical protein|nr:DUF5103 domain-containing protein [Flavobacteriales bacterium]
MKNNNQYLLILFAVLLSSFYSFGQEENIIFEDEIFNTTILTPLLHTENNPMSNPIIHLGTEEKLQLSFDDFSEDLQDYYYTIVHCNSDWTLSDLMQSEYIDGFFENRIEDYEFSFNTLQKYTHYNLVFPENYLKPLLSGNYIIKVFVNNNPKEVVLTRRFMVLDEKLNISSNVKRATLIDDREYKQEIDFTISHYNVYVANPYSDIKVVIKQNNREDNSITNLQPLFVKQDQLIYNYESENTFEAGNEFRHFDIKSIRYQSERIKEISSDSNNINVKLLTDISRSFEEFISIPDINGEFLINKQEAWNSETEAEYIKVNFSLLENRKISYGDIYLIGRFTDWKIKEDYKLQFNEISRRYECIALLKQGYYNYLYIVQDHSNKQTNLTFIEGSHYQTKNDYYIYVYYREIGKNYEQLIGFKKTSSELF